VGLAVNVGVLAYAVKHDPESAAWLRSSFVSINRHLALFRLPQHHEPEQLPHLQSRAKVTGYPNSCIHHLRRVYGKAIKSPHWEPAPVPAGQDAALDPVFRSSNLRISRAHLVCHSDVEGFYVPLDFNFVISGGPNDRPPGGPIGPSMKLMQELASVAPRLGIGMNNLSLGDAEAGRLNQEALGQIDPLWIEKMVWLSLFEAARLSIEYKTAVCFQ
jgi:hypothetical protein